LLYVVIPPISAYLMDFYGPVETFSLTIPLLFISMVILAFIPKRKHSERNYTVLKGLISH
jgi:hypothetical protein